MAAIPKNSEEDLVAKRNKALKAKFKSRRTKSLVLAGTFALACAMLLFIGMWAFAVCALFVSAICVSGYYAANGHFQRIKKRETHQKKLARDFSKLEPDEPNDKGSPAPHASGIPTPSR